MIHNATECLVCLSVSEVNLRHCAWTVRIATLPYYSSDAELINAMFVLSCLHKVVRSVVPGDHLVHLNDIAKRWHEDISFAGGLRITVSNTLGRDVSLAWQRQRQGQHVERQTRISALSSGWPYSSSEVQRQQKE